MDRKLTCYCGFYCGNCAVKAKVEPASRVLYEEMKKSGFEDVMQSLPDGDKFWSFLKDMTLEDACTCRAGSGNPACKIRLCAEGKNVEMCAFCESYPCDNFTEFFEACSILKHDNSILREKGWETWGKLQDERQARGFTYSENGNE